MFETCPSSIQTAPLGSTRVLNVWLPRSIVLMKRLWISFCSNWFGSWLNSDCFCVSIRRFFRFSPPAKISFSSSVLGTNGFTTNDFVFVALRDAIKNRARVSLRQRPCAFCSSHTTTSTDDFPTQLTWPDRRMSESCCGIKCVAGKIAS